MLGADISEDYEYQLRQDEENKRVSKKSNKKER